MSVFELTLGQSPLLISVPHDGDHIPAAIMQRMQPYAHSTPDRDLAIGDIFNFHESLSATRIKANISRFVIDLNRSSQNRPLYPGQSETELCPTTLFDDRPIYLPEQQPNQMDIEQRIADFWKPYHDALQTHIERIRTVHGYCILIDAHSIAPVVPRFFSGTLPDINIGTNAGASCSSLIEQCVMDILQRSSYSHVLNGRFKGGHITRHYGQPKHNVHAVQFEIAQSTYLTGHDLSSEAEHLRALLLTALKQLLQIDQLSM